MSERVGPWMQTWTGRQFFPLSPLPEDVDIEDIAHALSHICRFGGHARTHYSVAEHSVRVSEWVADCGGSLDGQFAGLMHDAAEAYVGDMVWTIKQFDCMEVFRSIEDRVQDAIAKRFGFAARGVPIVKHADLKLLETERRDLLKRSTNPWHIDSMGILPLEGRIEPWSAPRARQIFLARFDDLALALGKAR